MSRTDLIWIQYLHADQILVRSSPNSSQKLGGARGVMVIVLGNGHGDTSSNPGRDWLHFT